MHAIELIGVIGSMRIHIPREFAELQRHETGKFQASFIALSARKRQRIFIWNSVYQYFLQDKNYNDSAENFETRSTHFTEI